MDKIEIIARRIMGWKLNRWDRWFDFEQEEYIPVTEFQPEENLDHAMRIVKRMEQLGFTYRTDGSSNACFNDVCETGETLAEAITNAAYSIAEVSSVPEEWL